jgi:murein DD-endopeptidase MepM/ murein hydrolase activator NlpD
MRNIYSKTYRVGKLSITVSVDDLFVIYRGRGKIYFYKFNRHFFPQVPGRKIALCAAAVLICGTTAVMITGREPSEKTGRTDEEIKNRLIVSKRTDFSAPRESNGLQIRTHRIRKGETLGQIAKEYGVSIDTICGNNRLTSYDIVREGTVLNIPSRDGVLYTVKRGQNVFSISRIYRVPVEKILAENRLGSGDFVAVGTSLFIPDAKPLDMVPGFLWPAMRRAITSGYGWRRNPFNTSEMDFHMGLDIRSNYEWVKATKYGKVTYAGWLGGYGKTVLVAHPGGWKSLYGHLSRIIVREGQYVKQGQFVGKSGTTGYSSGPHLHFELIKSGKHVNPYRYLK